RAATPRRPRFRPRFPSRLPDRPADDTQRVVPIARDLPPPSGPDGLGGTRHGPRPWGRLTMYESHFGLRERPFRPTPDCGAYYPATSHERALTRLLQALADDEGIVLLTGEPGTGKTLLCHCLLERLGPDVASAFVTNSHLADRASLLQALLYDLSLPYEGR